MAFLWRSRGRLYMRRYGIIAHWTVNSFPKRQRNQIPRCHVNKFGQSLIMMGAIQNFNVEVTRYVFSSQSDCKLFYNASLMQMGKKLIHSYCDWA